MQQTAQAPHQVHFKRFGSVIMLENQDISRQDGECLLVKCLAYCNSIVVRIRRVGDGILVGVDYLTSYPFDKELIPLARVATLSDLHATLACFDNMLTKNALLSGYFNLGIFDSVEKTVSLHFLRKELMAVLKDDCSPFERRARFGALHFEKMENTTRRMPSYMAEGAGRPPPIKAGSHSRRVCFSYEDIETNLF
jgi:hypothetical protein